MTATARDVPAPSESEDDNPRLDAWLRRTTVPLDAIALCTIWLTVVPLGAMHRTGGHAFWWYLARILISFVYLVDITVRTALARRKMRYLVTHPVGLLSVVIPALRLIFSLRLLRAMFRKGNLGHFLGVAVILFANLAVIVYGFEHTAPGANITTIGISSWWACVTLFTVGYGDYYPITTGGRLFAVLLMALGLVVAAVITAQIAASFMDQAAARRAASVKAGEDPDAPREPATDLALEHFQSIAERMEQRLISIERAMTSRPASATDDLT